MINEETQSYEDVALAFSKRVRSVELNAEKYYDFEGIKKYLEDPKPTIRQQLHSIFDKLLSDKDIYSKYVIELSIQGESKKFINSIGVFRLLQDIKSSKAEQIRNFIAEAAFAFAQEQAEPELAVGRAMSTYKSQGQSDEWIQARMQNIVRRRQYTDAMKQCGAKDGDYGILTNKLHQRAFGISVSDHKQLKGLGKHNLRDNMSTIELAIQTLGETVATTIANEAEEKTMLVAHTSTEQGGDVACAARENIERIMQKPVVSSDNFLRSSTLASRTKGNTSS